MASHSARRTQLTIALTLVLFALMAVIAWMEFGGKNNGSQTVEVVDTIVITRKGHKDITLVRDASNWRMTTPFSLNANAQRVEPLLNLSKVSFDGYAASEVDLTAAGLTQPSASITFDQRTFLLGDTDADDERRYTMIDNQVGFVPAWVWSLIHGGVTAFADLTVFNALPDALYLADGDNVKTVDNADQWKDLQADKIVPMPDSSETGMSTSSDGNRVLKLRTTDDTSTGDVLATIIQLNKYAVISTQPGFAFAISNAQLDTLLNP